MLKRASDQTSTRGAFALRPGSPDREHGAGKLPRDGRHSPAARTGLPRNSHPLPIEKNGLLIDGNCSPLNGNALP